MYQGRLRSDTVRSSTVEVDKGAEMSEGLAGLGRVSGSAEGDAHEDKSRLLRDSAADSELASRIRQAASVLGVREEAIASLCGDENSFPKREEFFPAVENLIDERLTGALRDDRRGRAEDREFERAERE